MLLGKAPNWQRLKDGIKAICHDPDMNLRLECHEKKRELVAAAGAVRVVVPYAEIEACEFWTIAIRHVGYKLLEAMQKTKEQGNG